MLEAVGEGRDVARVLAEEDVGGAALEHWLVAAGQRLLRLRGVGGRIDKGSEASSASHTT